MRGSVALFILISISFAARGQYSRYIIQLTDKKATTHTLGNPSTYLTTKSISRRSRFNISLDSTDLPVVKAYIDSIRNAGNVRVISSSKWLNQVLIQTTDDAALARINRLPFVQRRRGIARTFHRMNQPEKKFKIERPERSMRSGTQQIGLSDFGVDEKVGHPKVVAKENIKSSSDSKLDLSHNVKSAHSPLVNIANDIIPYGNSYGQVHIHEGEYLHNAGYQGKGITIAVLDAGFLNYQTLRAFDSLRIKGRILGTWDLVANESSVNEDDAHGMYCLSIMAANLPGQYVGTAPQADYYLFRTEDVASEFPVEEHNWVVAAEMADSLGADMISSSLGYSQFDDAVFDYRYSDMNGNTTMVTRGADLAVKKGMIVCNSAGNSGGDPWKYITAPADGDSVLAIGAVNVAGTPAWFTSQGPSADGQVKPDVASVGDDTFIISTFGNVARGDGTSFSNPNLAGLIACLWQAFPEYNNMTILDAVKKSSPTYSTPNNLIGYGIPNMRKAFDLLLEQQYASILKEKWIRVFPNPFQSDFKIVTKIKETGLLIYQLSDLSGRVLFAESKVVQQDQLTSISITNLAYLPKGMYQLHVKNGDYQETIRLLH